ncbi:hypothetical protein BJX64DRAFT_294386 [Aspergillus heterothallicus]
MSYTNTQTVRLNGSSQLGIAQGIFGLDCLFAATSLGLGVGALVLRRQQQLQGATAKFRFAALPQWTVIGFLWVNFLYAILISVRYGLPVTGASLYDPTDCANTEAPSDKRIRIHWVLVGLCVALTVVDWGLLTKNQLIPQEYGAAEREDAYVKAYAGFDTATYLVRLGVSGKILWYTVRLFVRTVGRRSRWRAPYYNQALSILLLITAVFFFALNLMWSISDIRWLLVPAAAGTGYNSDYDNAYDAINICQAERDKKEEDERARLPPEADSRPRVIAEVDGKGLDYEADSVRVNEADSVPVLEADHSARVSRPPVELDSMELTELPESAM